MRSSTSTACSVSRPRIDRRPNPYAALKRGGIELHFFGLPDFDPAQSYSSCIVLVPDTAELFEAFAAGMRTTHGKLLLSGIPRMTRPRKRKNTGNAAGFTVVDPGGNWIRIFRMDEERDNEDAKGADDVARSPLARALQNAVVLGESKGDDRQAAKILDARLAKDDEFASVTERVEALVYRAELGVRRAELDKVKNLLARVHDTSLDDSQHEQLSEALANAAELESAVRAHPDD